ncbi:MAG: hypothetical protein CM15mP93_02600 [Thiotrichaceae bacterium]|nr:MAG: hypothetical protein CM15mP93_02600 [Thiotrichaceae bacterium]
MRVYGVCEHKCIGSRWCNCSTIALKNNVWQIDLSMGLNGAIAGLVSITAEPLAPAPEQAALIGAVGGIIVVISVIFLDKMKVDDPVGAISAHGTAGIWGLIAVAFTNADATIGVQLYGTIVIFLWTFIAAGITWEF